MKNSRQTFFQKKLVRENRHEVRLHAWRCVKTHKRFFGKKMKKKSMSYNSRSRENCDSRSGNKNRM
jgi:hypothetical protein